MVLWRFKSCDKCHGDLVTEEGQWRCLQCGRYYYPDSVQAQDSILERGAVGIGAPVRARNGKGNRVERNINSMILSRSTSDEKWWANNRQIIAYLDEGKTVGEIARLMARGPRQIRVIRERLADLRGTSPELVATNSA